MRGGLVELPSKKLELVIQWSDLHVRPELITAGLLLSIQHAMQHSLAEDPGASFG